MNNQDNKAIQNTSLYEGHIIFKMFVSILYAFAFQKGIETLPKNIFIDWQTTIVVLLSCWFVIQDWYENILDEDRGLYKDQKFISLLGIITPIVLYRMILHAGDIILTDWIFCYGVFCFLGAIYNYKVKFPNHRLFAKVAFVMTILFWIIAALSPTLNNFLPNYCRLVTVIFILIVEQLWIFLILRFERQGIS